MAAPYSISLQSLFSLIGKPDAPDVIDVCIEEDHALDPRVIPGATRMSYHEAAESPSLGTSTSCVIVCQKGLKLSQGVAARLRAQGRDAVYLSEGMVGWARAGLPAWPSALAPQIGRRGTFWVMPDTPCPRDIHLAWITARFIDPAPVWGFVACDQIANVADRFEAGTLELAQCITELETGLRARFGRLEALVAHANIMEILNAHCNAGQASGKWLEQIFPMLDAMWVCAGEAEQ